MKNGKGKIVTLIDGEGNETQYLDETLVLNVSDANANEVKALSKIYKIDATARTTDVNLIANSKNNTIIGGTGNDTITTGNGKDVYIYQGGNDVITDYNPMKDKICTNGKASTVEATDKDAIINLTNGSITVKNAAGKNLNIIEDTWFTAENVVTSEFAEIIQTTETDYLVGKLDNYNELTKSLNTITYNKIDKTAK